MIFLAAGVTLEVEPVTPNFIREYSTMTRSLCVLLADVGDGLERTVFVDIDFVPEGYSVASKFAITKLVSKLFISL